jgi:hypothetical protein
MNHDYDLPIGAFLLLDKVYPQDGWLTKMKEQIPKPIYKHTPLPDIEPHCAGGYDFDRIQTRYHGIPEHLIAARDYE